MTTQHYGNVYHHHYSYTMCLKNDPFLFLNNSVKKINQF